MEREEKRGGLVGFVENTNNVANLAFINMVLSGIHFYNDGQMPGAMEKMATEVDPFFVFTLVFLFATAGIKALAMYES